MSESNYIKSKSSNPKILSIYSFIVNNKEEKKDFWEESGGISLHNYLINLKKDDFEELIFDIPNWNELEMIILTDCIAYGIDGKYISNYENENRILAQQLYYKLPNGFKHPELRKWQKNYKIHSKTQSKNPNILSVYNFMLQHEYDDGDFWSFGGGSWEIQKKLNHFNINDWTDLRNDILNWEDEQIEVLIESIPYNFPNNMLSNLSRQYLINASEFLLDLFFLTENTDFKFDIAHSSYFLNEGNGKNYSKLNFLKNWMIDNGFNHIKTENIKFHPMQSIEEALKKACR